MTKKIYIAGPMRGLPDGNLAAFDEAETRWRAAGWQAMSPARLVRALNYKDEFCDNSRSHLNHVFQIDLACLFAADAVALLPGWQRSVGATAELALAHVLGLEQYDAVTMKQINVEMVPWSTLILTDPVTVLERIAAVTPGYPTKTDLDATLRKAQLLKELDACFCDDYDAPECDNCARVRAELFKLDHP